MDSKGRLLGDRSNSGSNSSLVRNAPGRQSLRKRIWKSIRPRRPDDGHGLNGFGTKGSSRYTPGSSGTASAVRSHSSSGEDSTSSNLRSDYHPYASKTASLDRITTRNSPIVQTRPTHEPDASDGGLQPRKLTRSKSLRERTGRVLSAVRRGVDHHRHRPAADGQHSSENSEQLSKQGEQLRSNDAGRRQSENLEKLVSSPDAKTGGLPSKKVERTPSSQQASLHASGAENRSAELSDSGEERSSSSRGMDGDVGRTTSATGLTPSRSTSTSDSLGLSPVSNSRQGPNGGGYGVAGFISKKWRSRPKLSGSVTNDFFLWTPAKGECEWQSLSGRSLNLVDTDVLALSEVERYTLQKVAADEAEQFNIANIAIPREDGRPPLRRGLSFRNRPKGTTTDSIESKGKSRHESKGSAVVGTVFGIPLTKVILNDVSMNKYYLSASTPLSDKGKGSPSSEGFESNLSTASSMDSLSDIMDSSELSAVNSPEIMATPRYPTPPGHMPPLHMVDMGTGHSVAQRAHSLPTSRISSVKVEESNALPPSLSARSSGVTQPFILEDDLDMTCLPARAYSVGTSPSSRFGNKPPYFGKKVQSHGQVTPPPDVEASNRLQEDLHTPLSLLSDLQGRSYSVDRLLDALVLDPPNSTSPNNMAKRHCDKQATQDMLAPQQPRVPVLVTAAVDFLSQYGLSQEGIFRKEGSRRRCRQLHQEIDSGYAIQFSKDDHQVTDVAAVLKYFFRDLPEPLLTRTLYPAFLAVASMFAIYHVTVSAGHFRTRDNVVIGKKVASLIGVLCGVLGGIRSVAHSSERLSNATHKDGRTDYPWKWRRLCSHVHCGSMHCTVFSAVLES